MRRTTTTLAATCLRWRAHGVLLEGPSAAGKSDLALRLLDAGARLVADDTVRIERVAARLVARPAGLVGHLEVRGQGIYVVPHAPATTLDLVVRLAAGRGVRLPPPSCRRLLGIELPLIELDPALASAVARIRIALGGRRVA
jgi:HPr kinase/phosphorylase